MCDNIISSFESQLRDEVNQILPDAYDRVDKIASYSPSIGSKILTILIEYSCLGQNAAPILLARNKIKKIPSNWLIQHIPEIAKASINFEDEWEYRRLLELLSEVVPELLSWAIDQGIDSTNEEVREAAEDFKKK